MSFGAKSGSCGKLFLKGGTLTCSYQLRFGEAGYGEAEFDANATLGRGLGLGRDSTGVGIARMGAVSISTGEPGGTHGVYVGQSGHGELYMKGTTITITKSSPVTIAENAGSFGLVRGWGAFENSRTVNKNFTNNGLVIADGEGADRDLAVSASYYIVTNSRDNETTNGWYAVGKGCLSLPSPTFSEGASVAVNWGEAQSDEEIDLVNSARVVLANVESGGGSLTGKLYAPDRSDVPALPSGKEAVGVWKFDINGAYESATVEFRYDHVKAPHGVQMYQLNADGETWTKLGTELLDGHRAKVAVTDASRMFAARPNIYSFTIVIR